MHLEVYGMWQQQQQHQQAYLRGLPPQHPQQQTLHPGIIGTDNHTPHQPHQQHHHQHHRATIMDLPVPSNPRASRNMAEKQRRDNLNANISTMATLVPSVAGSSRRMDKISILRLATAFLRTRYTLGSGSMNFLPPLFKDQFDLEQFFVDHLVDSEGFFLVVTATGKIVYVSRQVEQHLGHVQNELLGQSLYNFVYPEDHDELTRNLTPDGMPPMSTPSGVAQVSELAHDNNSSSSEESSTANHRTNERIKRFREQRRNFKIRLAQRTNSRRDHTQYECFDISGLLRLAEACKNADTNGNRGRQRETTSTSNDIVFAGVATLPKKRPITELSIMDANKDEYVTRHLVDGRIIYCDHRVSVVAGYMSEEVSGLNAFAFMHKDDFRWTMIGLRQMYDRAETCGTSCYRLLTKTGEFIYLRTHGYLEFDKDTQTVESFVCVNTLVSEEEGVGLIKEMKARFSATVAASSRGLIRPSDINSPIEVTSKSQASNPRCSLEDPSQLEDAITHLISDLPSPAVSEDRFSPSPMPHTQYVKAAIFSSRMPPAATHANKIGIKKIDRCVVIQGKGKVSPKQESKHTVGKLINSNSAELSPISDSESAVSSGKPLSMFEMMHATHNSHNNVQNTDVSAQSKILAARKSGSKSSRMPRSHTSCLDVPQSANGLNGQEKVDQRNVDNQESTVLQYFDDSASDSSGISSGIVEMHNRGPLKRICSDENLLAMQSKKRSNDVYASTNASSEQQRISYLKCRSFATEYPAFPDEFSQYNDVNSQSLAIAESPNSSLHEVGTDYQQLVDPTPLGVTNHDEEQFIELQDLKEDTLLSSELGANSELMMKIFDGLRNGPAGFENFNEAKMQQLTSDNQVVNDELSRTYYQLADRMALHESQINVLARDLKNPALRAQRENLTQLQAEYNMQKQMLKTIQQDRCKMQVNAKQKFGI
ncbi:PREDICTED: circadian locomoter output cycles protein kaput-like isoform X2 [Wasmannia auropunctata]|uniref:circadian locomoter output cycles protein kaput-like isoform X2 n=1 Tax=Wasmannia auropunctata TaxID=64793 RepID=UPI0005EDA23A|nr:PREDICTED: circadian locomoter output cycles protein kaput-like isoform X2 [Wasmannia auropunctata]